VQKFAADVVEAAENLRRGIAALPAPSGDQPEILVKVREGIEGVERSFLGILERHGVSKTDPVGQPFDPREHEAVAQVPASGKPPGEVLQEHRKGWKIRDRILRPAVVSVAAD